MRITSQNYPIMESVKSGEENSRSSSTQQHQSRTSSATLHPGSRDSQQTSIGAVSTVLQDVDLHSLPESEARRRRTSRETEGKPTGRVIAQQESRSVWLFRLIVIAVLLTSTIVVAILVYKLVSEAEEADFESQFEDDSAKVLEAIGSALDLTLGSVDAFLVGLASFAKDRNDTWPFVTYPDYAVRLAKLRGLSKAVLVTQYHYVTGEQRADWEAYSVENDAWVQEGIDVQATDESFEGKIVDSFYTNGEIHDTGEPYTAPGPYLAKWQQAPVIPVYAPYNWDAMTYPSMRDAIPILQGDRRIAFGGVSNLPIVGDDSGYVESNNEFISDYVGEGEDETEPFSDVFFPILDYAADFVTIPSNSTNGTELGEFVGVFGITFYWRALIQDILPKGSNGIVVVFENACGQSFAYRLQGPDTVYLGEGDLHQVKYDYLSKHSYLVDLDKFARNDRFYKGLPVSEKGCAYYLSVYPSSIMEDDFSSDDPLIFTVAAISIFGFTSLIFFFYDYMVERRQKKVMQTAVQSSAIVSSLFPGSAGRPVQPDPRERYSDTNRRRIASHLSEVEESPESTEVESKDRPIADMFQHCTVVFCDIAGFTAWTSVHDPDQVFTLLEALYGSFDNHAKRRGVLKVDTVGDAYVAVAGLPEPRMDHAVAMTKFAKDCVMSMRGIARDLEKSLGPGTGDLRLRVGMHSGPITAGVLRGEKGRFQLFGETVNTASRMEFTGVADRIQVSSSTAELLVQAGKGIWVKAREELVRARGKGVMQTFWIQPKLMGPGMAEESVPSEVSMDSRTRRLVEFNLEILSSQLKQVIAKRNTTASDLPERAPQKDPATKRSILSEVKDVIEFPSFDEANYSKPVDPAKVRLEEVVSRQLRDYIVSIAMQYNAHSFHCFQHASHVAMSTAKLLNNITRQELLLETDLMTHGGSEVGLYQHEHSFGLSSDPLAQFALVFAAMVHDVGHPGVPNPTLVEEKASLTIGYSMPSIAEQNSVDLAWQTFMAPPYTELRQAICPSQEDLDRFRQLIVNAVMATDVLDVELNRSRSKRWEMAFAASDKTPQEVMHEKGTLLLELLIQASDVAHTMQHWNIYRKWNDRLFEERSAAYLAGRSQENPVDSWYEGELDFLDHFVLPLATRLKQSGALGDSGVELLNYATKNRSEWARIGKEEVAAMAIKLSQPDLGAAGSLVASSR